MNTLGSFKVQTERLFQHLNALEGERHPFESRDRLKAAEEYVNAQWRSWKLDVSLDEFSYNTDHFVNLIARPHKVPPGPRLIIGAHLDTVLGTPGADDNASGVSVMLEASRIIAESGSPIPVEFVGFSLEEQGMVGSAHYANSLRRARTRILGMISLEMVGFTENQGLQKDPLGVQPPGSRTGDFIGIVGNRRSCKLLRSVESAMRQIPGLPIEAIELPAWGESLPEARLSDHSPFWDRGYSALMLTDTAFFRNPNYHVSGDTIDTLDLAFMTKVCQGLIAVVEMLALPHTDKAQEG